MFNEEKLRPLAGYLARRRSDLVLGVVVGVEDGRFFVACGNEVPQAQVEPLRGRLFDEHMGWKPLIAGKFGEDE